MIATNNAELIVTELKARSHDLGVSTEYFLDLLKRNITDIPAMTMVHLNNAQREIEAAIMETKDYIART